MRKLFARGGIAGSMLAALCGCGGNGSANAVQAQPLVVKLANPAGAPVVYVYGINNGALLGTAYRPDVGVHNFESVLWPTGSSSPPIVIPNMDVATVNQSAWSISPNGELLAGYSSTTGSSVGPKRGFVYNRGTRRFLQLKFPSYQNVQVYPTSIGNDGVVRGSIQYGPSAQGSAISGKGSLGSPTANISLGYSSFTYSTLDDTFTVSTKPDYSPQLKLPAGSNGKQVFSYSTDYSFAVGLSAFGAGNERVTLWNVNTGAPELIDLAGQRGGENMQVSNDGKTAFYYENSSQSTYLWTKSKGAQPLLKIVKSTGLCGDWNRTNFELLSDDGKFLTTTGMINDKFTNAVCVNLWCL